MSVEVATQPTLLMCRNNDMESRGRLAIMAILVLLLSACSPVYPTSSVTDLALDEDSEIVRLPRSVAFATYGGKRRSKMPEAPPPPQKPTAQVLSAK